MSITTIKDAFQAWAYAASGLTSIWRDQGAPRPSYPYVVLALVDSGETASERKWSYSETAPAGSNYTPSDVVHERLVLSVQVFTAYQQSVSHATSAMEYCRKIRDSLHNDAYLASLRAQNIAHVSSGRIQDLSYAKDGQQFGRAVIDIDFSTAETRTGTAGSYINSVLVSSDIAGAKDEDNINFTDQELGG